MSRYLTPTIWIVLVFCALPWLMSLTSGWYTLSKRFREQSEPIGKVREPRADFLLAKLRHQGYGSTLRISSDENALYLSLSFILRIAHPPLAIPWGEIALQRRTVFGFPKAVLILGKIERIPLRISEQVAIDLGILDGPYEQKLYCRPE
jgi:hypothetical protein